MASARAPTRRDNRTSVLRSITTPLGFYVLALIIVETILALVLTCSKLNEEHVWTGFLWMLGIFVGEMLIITGLTVFAPKNLLYGKEEHREPLVDPSALKDQIEDRIVATVKPEALKLPEF